MSTHAAFKILLSYHYFRDQDMGAVLAKHFPGDLTPEVFADSGAYSALTQGAPVDLHAYARWLVEHKHLFAVYANLDVIGDGEASAEGTWRNQRVLEDEYGLAPLPVFHASEPWSALDRYLDAGYRYIALGGLVGRPRPSIMPWLVRCFQRGKGQAVFHGFGLTSWEPLAALPWYSVDSSSWGAPYRYGTLRLFDETVGRQVVFPMGRHTEVYAHAPLIRSYGLDPELLASTSKPGRAMMCGVSAVSWRRCELWLRKRHGRIDLPTGGAPAGLRGYLADANQQCANLREAAKGLRLYNADGSLPNLTDGAKGLRLYLADTNANDLGLGAAAVAQAEKQLPQEATP